MTISRAKIRLLALALSLTASSAWAGAAPDFSGDVALCGNRLLFHVDIQFASTATTASVLTRVEPPRRCPTCTFPTHNLDYYMKAGAKASQNPSTWWVTPWIGNEVIQQGIVGVQQQPIEVGHSTFVQALTCKINGVAVLSVKCPAGSPMQRDLKTFPRDWAGCGQ